MHLLAIRKKRHCIFAFFSRHSGIGLELSLLFASEEADFVLINIDPEAVESVATLLATPNVNALATKTDVSRGRDKGCCRSRCEGVPSTRYHGTCLPLQPLTGMASLRLPPYRLDNDPAPF